MNLLKDYDSKTTELKLSHLNLEITNEFVETLNTFNHLKVLDLSHNNITILPPLRGLTSLVELDLTGNPLKSPRRLKDEIKEWGLENLVELKIDLPPNEEEEDRGEFFFIILK
jgi:Leucine-rich repeat (LRR) protein